MCVHTCVHMCVFCVLYLPLSLCIYMCEMLIPHLSLSMYGYGVLQLYGPNPFGTLDLDLALVGDLNPRGGRSDLFLNQYPDPCQGRAELNPHHILVCIRIRDISCECLVYLCDLLYHFNECLFQLFIIIMHFIVSFHVSIYASCCC